MKTFILANYILEPAEKLSKRMIYKDQNVVAFTLNIAKGESLPSHTHFDCTVLLQVIAGNGKLNVNGQTVTLDKGALAQLDGPENMSVDNAGEEPLVLYVTISPAPPSEGYAKDIDM